MKKILVILLCLSLNAEAIEVGGVVLNDTVHLGRSNLVLNGAGVRSKFIFELYVAALYLGSKKYSATDVLADPGEKRIYLQILSKINAQDLIYTLNKAIDKNSSDAELAAITPERREFDNVFQKLGYVNKGDYIQMDYLPETGTLVTVNGALRATIKGAAFYNALLKIWLGEKPGDETLKLQLLGGK